MKNTIRLAIATMLLALFCANAAHAQGSSSQPATPQLCQDCDAALKIMGGPDPVWDAEVPGFGKPCELPIGKNPRHKFRDVLDGFRSTYGFDYKVAKGLNPKILDEEFECNLRKQSLRFLIEEMFSSMGSAKPELKFYPGKLVIGKEVPAPAVRTTPPPPPVPAPAPQAPEPAAPVVTAEPEDLNEQTAAMIAKLDEARRQMEAATREFKEAERKATERRAEELNSEPLEREEEQPELPLQTERLHGTREYVTAPFPPRRLGPVGPQRFAGPQPRGQGFGSGNWWMSSHTRMGTGQIFWTPMGLRKIQNPAHDGTFSRNGGFGGFGSGAGYTAYDYNRNRYSYDYGGYGYNYPRRLMSDKLFRAYFLGDPRYLDIYGLLKVDCAERFCKEVRVIVEDSDLCAGSECNSDADNPIMLPANKKMKVRLVRMKKGNVVASFERHVTVPPAAALMSVTGELKPYEIRVSQDQFKEVTPETKN